MKKQKIELNFEFANIQEYNDGFLIASCPVFYAGNNRNRSHFTQECAEKMMSKAAYVPVVAEFKEEGFGSHGGRLEVDDDGVRYVDTTTIIGCVLAEKFTIETINEKDYYCVKIALYKQKYEQIEEFLNTHTGQSMEISIIEGDYDESEDMFYIKDARLDALCVLGNCMPCFQDSTIRYSLETDEESKAKFEFAYSEIINKVKEVFEAKDDSENTEEDEDKERCSVNENSENETEEEDFATEDNEEDSNSDEEEEVEDTADNSETEDENEDEETEEEGFSMEEYKALITEYSALQEKFNALSEEVISLREFKANIEKEENKVAVDEIASKFNLDEEEISDLREKAYSKEITLDVFEDKLFALVGRKLLKNKNFSKQDRNIKSKIKTTNDDVSGEFGILTSLIKK